jgi:hypothetical protein
MFYLNGRGTAASRWGSSDAKHSEKASLSGRNLVHTHLQELIVTDNAPFRDHLTAADDLVTTYEQTRAGFLALALEKNRQATPFVQAAKALRSAVSTVAVPHDLLQMQEIEMALLTAAGVSDKAAPYLTSTDRSLAIETLIRVFLEPAGPDFRDELIYRFLLTRGDSLGGSMRNLGGVFAERKLSRAIIASLTIEDRPFWWLSRHSNTWIQGDKNEADIEGSLRGICWQQEQQLRMLLLNLKVPVVNKNVDLCLLKSNQDKLKPGKQQRSALSELRAYVALGELKGGIDPAGADEHWKTANSALLRVRRAFGEEMLKPHTFFIGAAIAKSMASEIFEQLQQGTLTNAANLTDEAQLMSICRWLIHV